MRQLKLGVKAWNKFDYESQVKILQKYDVPGARTRLSGHG